ncbi:MAG TPA: hypothetical protein VIW73_09100 [Candidatus Cybelea sp.]
MLKVASAIALALIAQTAPVATGDFDGCPVVGSGGDPALNSQKNRSALPTQSPAPFTVAQMDQLPTVPSSEGRTRSRWMPPDQNAIQSQEQQAVMLTVYVVRAIAEGPETCNCESTSANDHDVHVYVGDDPDTTSENAAIVEVTPRWRAVNPSWNAQNLQTLADSGTPVRITGMLMYDQEHWDMIAKHERATLWEVHPVTDIQVQTPRGWVELANYQP